MSLKIKNYRRRELDWYRRRGLCAPTGCDIAVGTGKGGFGVRKGNGVVERERRKGDVWGEGIFLKNFADRWVTNRLKFHKEVNKVILLL